MGMEGRGDRGDGGGGWGSKARSSKLPPHHVFRVQNGRGPDRTDRNHGHIEASHLK